MNNNDSLIDELYSVNNELDSIVDTMIEKYGKFITISEVNRSDRYQADLVRNLNSLQKKKDYLIDELNVSQR